MRSARTSIGIKSDRSILFVQSRAISRRNTKTKREDCLATSKKSTYENMNKNSGVNPIQQIIKSSKWLLVPFYVGLIFSQVFYCIKFVENVWGLGKNFLTFDENQMMLAVLSLVDVVMIANLVRIIITGSYNAFVEKMKDSIENISSGYLKVKIGMSLIGVSSIHLLQAFINSSATSDREVHIKVLIHLVFLVSTIGLSVVEYLHQKSKTFETVQEGSK